MSFLKSASHIAAKATAVVLTCATVLSSAALISDNGVLKADAAERTLADGIYYIKNVHSNLYMDVYGNGTNDGTKINQYQFHGAMNQRFRVTYHSNDGGYYTIQALNTNRTVMFDLESRDASMTNGTDLQIWEDCNSYVAEQRFTIRTAYGGGYEIGTWATDGREVLEVTSSSTSNNAIVQIWERSDARRNDNWYFEKAPTGMQYIVNTTLSADDKAAAQRIYNRFGSIGYSASYLTLPSKAVVNSVATNSSVAVIHGHGSAGSISTPDGTITAANLNNTYLKGAFPQLNLIYFATCQSAATKNSSGNTVTSLVDASISKGAKCAIGFKNNVANAEDYFDELMLAIQNGNYLTLAQALNIADAAYLRKYPGSNTKANSPINPSNRVVKGNTNIILDLRIH